MLFPKTQEMRKLFQCRPFKHHSYFLVKTNRTQYFPQYMCYHENNLPEGLLLIQCVHPTTCKEKKATKVLPIGPHAVEKLETF